MPISDMRGFAKNADISFRFGAYSKKCANRVAGGFNPPAPTTPCVRVRTGRLIKSIICVFSGEDMFMMTVLHKQVTDLSGEDPTETYRRRDDKPESLAQQTCFV